MTPRTLLVLTLLASLVSIGVADAKPYRPTSAADRVRWAVSRHRVALDACVKAHGKRGRVTFLRIGARGSSHKVMGKPSRALARCIDKVALKLRPRLIAVYSAVSIPIAPPDGWRWGFDPTICHSGTALSPLHSQRCAAYACMNFNARLAKFHARSVAPRKIPAVRALCGTHAIRIGRASPKHPAPTR